MPMQDYQTSIDAAWEEREDITSSSYPDGLKDAVGSTIHLLDSGRLRVCEKVDGVWNNHASQAGPMHYYDKVALKFENHSSGEFASGGFRVVPPATVRRGAFIGKNVVLMPSYVNIGAFVDEGTMVDTWATVGSCAQIGRNVHLSGGVGIGGVWEPIQANPVIIEDNCFIGALSEVVEGVIVEENSVLSMGVFLSQSTKILDRATGQVSYGRIPAGSVVVPGSLPSKDGSHSLYCAVIVKTVDAQTRSKTAINELLRD
jgi:2,3,4,5-tetrahydropyridine-2,6-dicarboxylate N-succinyltransferase